MFDKNLVLLAPSNGMRGVMLIDIGLKIHCRTINLQYKKTYGNRVGIIESVEWVTCKGGKIYVLSICESGSLLCSIDFNGNILSAFCIPGSVADIDFDGSQRFFHTSNQVNDILYTSGKTWSTTKCYFCGILHVAGDELLLLEKSSNIVYKLNVKDQSRSILIKKNDIVYPTHFNYNHQIKKIAITMKRGNCIRIFPF